MRVDDVLVLSLESNFAVGASWKMLQTPPFLENLDDRGFRATSTGKGTLKFQHGQSWDPETWSYLNIYVTVIEKRDRPPKEIVISPPGGVMLGLAQYMMVHKDDEEPTIENNRSTRK